MSGCGPCPGSSVGPALLWVAPLPQASPALSGVTSGCLPALWPPLLWCVSGSRTRHLATCPTPRHCAGTTPSALVLSSRPDPAPADAVPRAVPVRSPVGTPCRELLLPAIPPEGSPWIHSARLTAWMRSGGSARQHGRAGQRVAPGDGSPCPCEVWEVTLVAGMPACHCLCWDWARAWCPQPRQLSCRSRGQP